MWYVYILECTDKTLYTGITNDIKRRLVEHNEGNKGARYTRARRPVKLVYYKKFKSRSRALQEECRIKKISRHEKLKIIAK